MSFAAKTHPRSQLTNPSCGSLRNKTRHAVAGSTGRRPKECQNGKAPLAALHEFIYAPKESLHPRATNDNLPWRCAKRKGLEGVALERRTFSIHAGSHQQTVSVLQGSP